MPAIYAVKAIGPSDAIVLNMDTWEVTHNLTVTRDFSDRNDIRPTLNNVLRGVATDLETCHLLTGEAPPANSFERLVLERVATRTPDILSLN